MVSVDLDEWYHSRRWVDGAQAHSIPDMTALFRKLYGSDTPRGEIVSPTRVLLDLFDRFEARCTFFVLGEVAEWYPELVREIAAGGHEIACHGMHHVDMTVLGPERFEADLEKAARILEAVSGRRPSGYRAPNLVYEPWATRILERLGFTYDSTVCVSRPLCGKYKGWARAPLHPYHPSYDNIAVKGAARLAELPLPSFPVVNLSAGSGIITRIVGFEWTRLALRHRIRTGDTGFYFHPWEVAERPVASGGDVRNRVFFRRTGPWMLDAVKRLFAEFRGRTATAGEVAAGLREGPPIGPVPGTSAPETPTIPGTAT